MKYEMHPLADVVPPMTNEEYEELKDDIKTHGLREPITLHEGKVIDGKHRYRACVELGIEPDTRELSGQGTPLQYIISENVKRRHLTVGQRAALAVELRPLIEKDMDDHPNIRVRSQGTRPQSVRSAADYVKVHPVSVEAYAAVANKAPDLAKEVRAGEKPLWTAHREMQAREPKSERRIRIPTKEQLRNRARDAGQHFAKSVASLVDAPGDLTMMDLWSLWAAIYEVEGYLRQISHKHRLKVPDSTEALERLQPSDGEIITG